jgi:hypothetical protein
MECHSTNIISICSRQTDTRNWIDENENTVIKAKGTDLIVYAGKHVT